MRCTRVSTGHILLDLRHLELAITSLPNQRPQANFNVTPCTVPHQKYPQTWCFLTESFTKVTSC